MFSNLIDTLTLKVSNFILQGVHSRMTDREFLEREIAKWKGSPKRVMQIKGSLYYDNEHDILKRKRTMIGEDGKLQVVDNLPNNRVIDNQYAKMVNQKANYLFGQPFAIECKNEQYGELLKKVFNKRFMKTLKTVARLHTMAGLLGYTRITRKKGNLLSGFSRLMRFCHFGRTTNTPYLTLRSGFIWSSDMKGQYQR